MPLHLICMSTKKAYQEYWIFAYNITLFQRAKLFYLRLENFYHRSLILQKLSFDIEREQIKT